VIAGEALARAPRRYLPTNEAGLAPAALAEKVGVSQEVIANLEAGKIEPQTDLIQHIACVLGRRLWDFVEQ
jgi:predicted transcriptional regulator